MRRDTFGRDAPSNPDGALVAVAAIHVVLTSVHGLAHASIPVPIADWQGAYSALVLFAAPVAGIVLVRRGRARAGTWLLVVAGVGALAFESLAHFGVRNPDHVASVEAGRALFAGTAGLSVAGDALLVAAGCWALWTHSQGRSRSAVTSSTR